jgi:hypothetical protein
MMPEKDFFAVLGAKHAPVFGHAMILSLPHSPAHIPAGVVALIGDGVMGTPQDHRKLAEECVALARAADDQKDKALWLTLAQSWVRLAEHVARSEYPRLDTAKGDDALAAGSSGT